MVTGKVHSARRAMRLFFGLQVADLASTITFRSMGVAETNPLASFLMETFGALVGLLILKMAAISIGLACKMESHPAFLRRINGVYCVILAFNYLTICNAVRH